VIRHRGVLTGSSYASMFFLGVGTVIIGAASGNIGLTPYQTGLLVSMQNVGFIIAVLVAGALADTADKARLMSAGSLVLAVSFFLYYLWSPYGLNLVIMFFVGIGIGTYEGVADAMLLSIHDRRQGLHISVNHFFVTFGCLATTLYLIFLRMDDWRQSMVQSAVVVLALAVVFLFSRAGTAAGGTAAGGPAGAGAAGANAPAGPGPLGRRLGFLRTQGILAVFFVLAIFGVGVELGVTGLLTTFLLDLRGYDQVASKIGLVLFLGGVASGRVILGIISGRGRTLGLVIGLFAASTVCATVAFFAKLPPVATGVVLFLYGMSVSSLLPLMITMTGILYREMSGTALSLVKLGIPIGGIVVPFVLSVVARWGSFQASLAIFPVLAAAGCALLAANARRIQARLAEKETHA
jgi:MFS family permease